MYAGKILAADTPENLLLAMPGNRQVIAEIAAPRDHLSDCCKELTEIERFEISPSTGDYLRCVLTPKNGEDVRPAIFALARDRGWPLRELTRNRQSLEDIYIQVTRPDEEEES
jgi:hypothetical protein